MSTKENPIIPIAAALAGFGVVFLLSRIGRATPLAPSKTLVSPQVWPTMPKAETIVVGSPTSPKVAPYLEEMRQLFRQSGIDLNLIDPVEVTTLGRAPGSPVAIPQRRYWPRMIQTIRTAFLPFRRQWGRPIKIIGGFRPEDYNKAVGGEEGSRHQWFEALDISPASATATDKRRFALDLARFWLRNNQRLAMGLGIYGREAPSGHIDTGWMVRTWGDADYWIDLSTRVT